HAKPRPWRVQHAASDRDTGPWETGRVRFPRLVEGRLVRRYKRFLADVELADGGIVIAHCPNPGSMQTCAPERARVWLSESNVPTRPPPFPWARAGRGG